MAKLNIAVLPVTPIQQNCTLIWDEESKLGTVIDPGGDFERIQEAINEIGLKLEHILLTHAHFDHVGAAMDLKQAHGVEIIGPHKDDAYLCDKVEVMAQQFGITEGLKNVTPDRWLQEGDEVEIAGHVFGVLHCPGHAPGHVVFYNKELKFAQVGDVLFHGSIGRTDLPGSNHDDLISSIKEKLLPLGDDMTFICGHGEGSTIGEERLNNPFLK